MILFMTEDEKLVSEWDDIRHLTRAIEAHGPRPAQCTGEVNHTTMIQWKKDLDDLMSGLSLRLEELREKTIDHIKSSPVVSEDGELSD